MKRETFSDICGSQTLFFKTLGKYIYLDQQENKSESFQQKKKIFASNDSQLFRAFGTQR